MGEDLARPRVEGGDRVPRVIRADGRPGGDRLLSGRVRLYDLHDRVEARSQRHGARRIIRQCRIDDRQSWQHPVIAQAEMRRLARNIRAWAGLPAR